jgi:hypothetical protein
MNIRAAPPTPVPNEMGSNDWAFDRSVEITLSHLSAAREIAIKLNHGHEPNPALVAGLVQAMATNYLAEMTGRNGPSAPKKSLPPLPPHKQSVDPLMAETWPALNQTVSFRVK